MSVVALRQPAETAWTPSRLTLPDDMDFTEWADVGSRLRDMGQSLMWWIGDWLLYGERFDVTYEQAERETRYSIQHLRDAKYVAKTYPVSDRSDAVPWSHHKVAASLPRQERLDLIAEAARRGWKRREMVEEIQRRRAVEIVQQTTAPSQPFDYALRCLARLVGAFVDLDPAEFIGNSKGTQAQVNARQMVMYLLLTDADFREIDIANGLGRHHSTVDHAVEKFTALREETEIDDALTRLGETYRLFRNTQAAAGLIAEMTA